MQLPAQAIAAGFGLEVYDSLGSTNDEALALARRGARGPLWVVAREQASGRGRLGRCWSSPRGNLYASLLLVDPCCIAHGPQLGFVASVALHCAITTIAGTALSGLLLKWPNDLLLNGAKLAGILVEGSALSSGGPLAIVIGIGVNVTSHPPLMPYPATDLASRSIGIPVETVFSALAGALASELQIWRRGDGFADIRSRWLARAAGIGGEIEIRRPDGIKRGLFRDLDASGRLILEESGALLTIEAGDVFPVEARRQDA